MGSQKMPMNEEEEGIKAVCIVEPKKSEKEDIIKVKTPVLSTPRKIDTS